MKKVNKGFSVIMAMLITAFLIILSSGILGILLEELKNTRLVYNSIVTYEAALGANEYALLKIKNHKEGFEDIITKDDYDYNLINNNDSSAIRKNLNFYYEIENQSKNFTGTINEGGFNVIPLYFDKGELIQVNSKNPSIGTSNTEKTNLNTFSASNEFVWNIIGNNSSGDTFGISGTGTIGSIIENTSTGYIKKSTIDSGFTGGIKKLSLGTMQIGEFISNYENPYLIIYNPSESNKLIYNISSDNGFTLPKIKITGSGKIGNYVSNIKIEENKNKYFEALMYNLYNK